MVSFTAREGGKRCSVFSCIVRSYYSPLRSLLTLGYSTQPYSKYCYIIIVTSADVSRNKFTEIPPEVLRCEHAEELNAYHNMIRSICDLNPMRFLCKLNLCRNQLTAYVLILKDLILWDCILIIIRCTCIIISVLSSVLCLDCMDLCNRIWRLHRIFLSGMLYEYTHSANSLTKLTVRQFHLNVQCIIYTI